MKASAPRDLPGLFLQALNSGDVDSVVALYEREGVVAPDPKSGLRWWPANSLTGTGS